MCPFDARLQERRLDRVLGGGDGGVLARRLADAHERRSCIAHDGLYVSEVKIDESRHGDEVGNALDALAQDIVGEAERIRDRGLLVDDLQQAVVRNRDDRVDVLLQLLDARLRLLLAQTSFKREGARDDADGQSADLTRTLGDDGRRSRARAAAHAGGHEDHVRALQRLQDVIAALFRRLLTDLGTRSRAKAARKFLADLDAFRRHRVQKSLRVRVDSDELHALQSR